MQVYSDEYAKCGRGFPPGTKFDFAQSQARARTHVHSRARTQAHALTYHRAHPRRHTHAWTHVCSQHAHALAQMHSHAQTRRFPVAHFVAAQNPLDCTETSHGNFRIARKLPGRTEPAGLHVLPAERRVPADALAHERRVEAAAARPVGAPVGVPLRHRRVRRRLARRGRAARHSHGDQGTVMHGGAASVPRSASVPFYAYVHAHELWAA